MKQGFMKGLKIFMGMVFLLNNQQTNAQTPRPIPAQYSSTTTPINYIRTWDATAPEKDPNALMGKSLRDVKQATQYIDGLGRPLQTVIKQGSLVTDPSNPASSANARDMVSPVEYDAYGREQHKYLPYAESIANDGLFKYNPFFQQAAFYNDPNGLLKGQGETFFYSKTNFETSPLSRVTDTYAPGNSWVGSEGSVSGKRKNVQIKYTANTVTDAVRIWKVTDNPNPGEFGTYVSTSIYPAGQLNKSITTDEQKKQVIEFKDKNGRVILKKVQLTATADDGTGSDYQGWLCTYYIYDDFDNLRCIIQPSGVKSLQPDWSFLLHPTLLDEQCFRYEYDQRDRVIKKKLPAAAAVSMVYDARDRMVLSQDGSLALQGKWMYTTYDELNRPVTTGLWISGLTREQHAGYAAGSTSYPVLSGEEELTRNFYNDYGWLNNYASPLPSSYNSSYDSYFQTASNVAWPYAQTSVQSRQTRGLETGTRIKILGTLSSYLYTVNFYDEKGRIIQTQSTNITGGTDIATFQYDWVGKPLIIVQKKEKQSANAQSTVVITEMTYDDLGRLTKMRKKLSNTLVKVNNQFNAMSEYKTIVQNEYNALGQLKRKKLAPDYNGGVGLETQNFDYNIRGWMLGINRDYVKDAVSNNYFGFDLGYDKANNNIIGGQTYNNPQYNGNIEGMVWKSKGDGEKRKYDFAYDAANRLLKADFTQYTNNAFNQDAGVNFNVKMGNGSLLPDGTLDPTKAYDDNGNILQMQQWGLKVNSSSQIDNLRYTYIGGTNRLKSVTDFNNLADSKLGDFKTNDSHPDHLLKAGLNESSAQSLFDGITDYTYDVNGNLNLDNNKGIGSIIYNHLNLPATITIPLKGTIEYTYDAGGNKLRKTTTDKTVSPYKITVTDYAGGLVYENDVLQFIPQEEGRIRFKPAVLSNTGAELTAASLQYDYMLMDHLGNVRMVLTEEQQVNRYPAATLEPSLLGVESGFYSIDPNKIVPNSAANYLRLPNSSIQQTYPNNNNIPNNNPSCGSGSLCTGDLSQNVYQLNGNSNKTGLGITLKVMAGDKIDVFGKSYYSQNTNGTNGNSLVQIGDLLAAFLGAPNAAGITGVHGAVSAGDINVGTGLNGINSMVSQQSNQSLANPNKPRAFINVIFFDEQFKSVEGNFKISMVGDNSIIKDHYADLQNLVANKNGYVYIYCSNESPVNVFFDNLQVVHTQGAILEETHYYPFGLTMAGISSKAAGGVENKHKFNGGTELESKEFSDGSGLELYATEFRNYDAQIGRFHQIDLLADVNPSFSSYSFANNNPISMNDPLGLETEAVGRRKHKETSTREKPKTLAPLTVVGPAARTNQNGNTRSGQNQAPQVNRGGVRTWDPVTDRRINQLDERVRVPVSRFINRVNSELGLQLRVAQGLRTLQEQDNLFAQGRTRPGQIVTNARGGQSYHNFGLAIDVYIVVNGRVDLNRVVPPEVVEIARQEGFEWGGSWRRFRDYPHFQMTFNQTLQQLRTQHGIHL